MKHKTENKNRLSRSLMLGTIAVLGAVGITLIGNGIWIKAKAELAQVLLNQAFERVLKSPVSSSSTFKPWSWADIEPVARLNAPRLNKTSIILNDTNGEALAFGPGHLPNTPLPGERGTSVLSGHRDTHFAWIKDLKNGDRINVENADGSKVSFSVQRTWIARFDASGIDADSDETLIALTTCYPFDAKTRGPLRYIVEARMVEQNTKTSMVKIE
ncbi:MAG: class GN sortase [Rhizobiaceae bacterium]|nr:class GN sortase [Rhizobiaceae bacterium]